MGIFDSKGSNNSSLTQDYNKSSGHASLLHWSHLALMITGMALPMVATATPAIGSATLLDVMVQTGYSIIEMANNTFEYSAPVMEAVWDNTMAGNLAPSTFAMGNMMPDIMIDDM